MRGSEGRDCVLGLDVGGTKMACAAFDRAGDVIVRSEIRSPANDEAEMIRAVLRIIEDATRESLAEGWGVKAVGIGAAAFILEDEGLIIESTNIDWFNVPLRRIVGRETGLATYMENDGNSAARGERFSGVARGVDDFIYLTLGTGIGGGICIGGEIYFGHRGTAAEIGHILIDPDGPECACGSRGCLESLASGTALVREAARLLKGEPDSLLQEMCGGDPGRLTGEMVSRAAELGDATAKRAFHRISYYLGLGLVNLAHIFDPAMVVIGGGVASSGHLVLDETRRVVSEIGIRPLVRDVKIVLSTLGTDAGLIGAAVLAWEGIDSRL